MVAWQVGSSVSVNFISISIELSVGGPLCTTMIAAHVECV